MSAFLFILAFAVGGSTLGVVAVIGVMLHSGRWTFPGGAQSEIQRAESRRTASLLLADAAEADFRREQAVANTDVLRVKAQHEIQRLVDEGFQRALESSESGKT